MKLIKKLLIFTLLVSMLVPATTKNAKKPFYETILLSDKNTKSTDYNDCDDYVNNPNLIQITKAI